MATHLMPQTAHPQMRCMLIMRAASASGNARDLASGSRVLAKVHAARGEDDDAVKRAREALELFGELGQASRGSEIRKGLQCMVEELRLRLDRAGKGSIVSTRSRRS